MRLEDDVRERSARFNDSCLNIIEEEFAELNSDERTDPRFIKAVMVKRG
jgi:hypothetical protein